MMMMVMMMMAVVMVMVMIMMLHMVNCMIVDGGTRCSNVQWNNMPGF